jgi:DNA-binding CsgD family transcriptional regulator
MKNEAGVRNVQDTSATRGRSASVQEACQAALENWEFSLYVLDAVFCPAIAIDQLGWIVGANAAMNTVFDDELRIKNKRLLIANAQARRRFEGLILRLGSQVPASLASEAPIVVFRGSGRRPVVVNMLPLVGQNAPFASYAIVTFLSLEPKRCPPISLLTDVFGFTPAEARLAAALASGRCVEEAAEQLNISCDTARHQLKAVFLKTDTHRQSQLVALLARL